MKDLMPLLLGIAGTLFFSWAGLTLIPNVQIGHLEPQMDEEGNDAYPLPQSGMVERGRKVYVANGCVYCHTQQVRADYAGSDIDRKWGERRSAPRDYIFDRPVLLGKMRTGPDLANIGKRAPAEDQNAAPAAVNSPTPASASAPAASAARSGSSPVAGSSLSPAAVAAAAAGNASPSPSATAVANLPVAGASPPADVAAVGNSPAASAAPSAAVASAGSSPATSAATAASSPAVVTAGTSPAASASMITTSPPATAPSPAVASAGTSPAPPAPAAANPAANAATSLDAAPATGGPLQYSAAWHHQHLYDPRSINPDSIMPAFRFLYDKRKVSGQRAADAVQLVGHDSARDGWEIVPTYDARCLVAYLMSRDQSHALNEVKSVTPPSPPAPGKAAK